MILNKPDIEIGKATFDDHDWLDRKENAHQLSELIERFSEPLVIAIDGDWGSGKSYFLKLWVNEHNEWLQSTASSAESKKRQSAKEYTKVIYFDAFKHDYLDDPLANLVVCLEDELGEEGGALIGKLKEAAIKLPVPIATALASRATGGLSDVILKSISDNSDERLWNKERERIKAMEEFKYTLSMMSKETRLVFVVDELDRCRPDYALKTLEIIKHLFQAEYVSFVLGANFTALESSVKFAYGETIDSEKYLKKFITIFMRLIPHHVSNIPTTLKYYNRLIAHIGESMELDQRVIRAVKRFLCCQNVLENLSLRDIDHLCRRMCLFPKFVSTWHYDKIKLLACMAVLEALDRKNLNAIISGSLNPEILELFLENNHILSAKDRNIIKNTISIAKFLNNPRSIPKIIRNQNLWTPGRPPSNNKDKHRHLMDEIFSCFKTFDLNLSKH